MSCPGSSKVAFTFFKSSSHLLQVLVLPYLFKDHLIIFNCSKYSLLAYASHIHIDILILGLISSLSLLVYSNQMFGKRKLNL